MYGGWNSYVEWNVFSYPWAGICAFRMLANFLLFRALNTYAYQEHEEKERKWRKWERMCYWKKTYPSWDLNLYLLLFGGGPNPVWLEEMSQSPYSVDDDVFDANNSLDQTNLVGSSSLACEELKRLTLFFSIFYLKTDLFLSWSKFGRSFTRVIWRWRRKINETILRRRWTLVSLLGSFLWCDVVMDEYKELQRAKNLPQRTLPVCHFSPQWKNLIAWKLGYKCLHTSRTCTKISRLNRLIRSHSSFLRWERVVKIGIWWLVASR